MSNPGTELRDEVVARINAAGCVTSLAPAVEAIAYDPGSSADRLRRGLTGAGLSIIVMAPDAVSPDSEAVDQLEFVLAVAVGERASANRGPTGTGVTAYDLAWSLAAYLHGYAPAEYWRPLEFRGIEQAQGTDPENRDTLVSELRFTASMRFRITEEEAS